MLTLQAGREQITVQHQLFPAVVAIRGEYRVSSDQARFDGGANAFATLRISQARGIADQQDAIVENGAMRVAKQAIGMAGDAVAGHLDIASLFEDADKFLYVAGDFVRISAAESDVEEVVLTKNPSVAAHVAAKEKFRKIARDVRTGSLCQVHLELDFLRHYRGRRTLVAEITRNRTEMSTGADENSRPDVAVH